MGSSTRLDFDKQRFKPGPNAYTPKETFTKIASASWGMGTGKRGNLTNRNESPGPGQYDCNLNAGGPKYAMGNKLGGFRKDNNPGPGTYEPKVEV